MYKYTLLATDVLGNFLWRVSLSKGEGLIHCNKTGQFIFYRDQDDCYTEYKWYTPKEGELIETIRDENS